MSARRRLVPYAWLGAGAITVGIGAALAHGSAVAHADDSPPGAKASSSTTSSAGKARPARTSPSANTTRRQPKPTTASIAPIQPAPGVGTARSARAAVAPVQYASKSAIARIPVGKDPDRVAISADGTRLYVANTGDGTVSVINTTGTPAVIATITVGSDVQDVALSPDGTRLYVATNGPNYDQEDPEHGYVLVYNITGTPAVVATVEVGTLPDSLAVSPDGTRVYVANHGEANLGGWVSVINTTGTPAVTSEIDIAGIPTDVVFSADGTRAYTINDREAGVSRVDHGRSVSVIDTSGTPHVVKTIHVPRDPISVAISPDGTHLYVLIGQDYESTLRVYDLASSDPWDSTVPNAQLELNDFFSPWKFKTMNSMVESPDGTRLYITRSDGGISIVGTNPLRLYNEIGGGNEAHGVAISPDGTRIYVASGNAGDIGVVTVFDTTVIPASANPPAEIQAELATARFNTSVFGGWIPIIGALYNANNLKLDIEAYKAAVASGNGDDMRDEQIDMFTDAVGMIPVVGAPIAGLIWAARNPGR
ncbi:40-residue YVTN family beta-propeller repeat protein [Mycolicibacterium rhodesiae JS60]|nr:40-residue YVTN family beta-propeller repeat protein [Mycolicibacterium rhodesiae JS60]